MARSIKEGVADVTDGFVHGLYVALGATIILMPLAVVLGLIWLVIHFARKYW